jgi:hypothetical protein
MIAMNYFIPYYVNEVQSEVRGVKRGWYTMDDRGKLVSGPFSCACECLESGDDPEDGPARASLH